MPPPQQQHQQQHSAPVHTQQRHPPQQQQQSRVRYDNNGVPYINPGKTTGSETANETETPSALSPPQRVRGRISGRG